MSATESVATLIESTPSRTIRRRACGPACDHETYSQCLSDPRDP
jgi:hypothetical protein